MERDRELERRLSSLERDNELLINTLTGIAGSFGVLKQLLPAPSPLERVDDEDGNESSGNYVARKEEDRNSTLKERRRER
jgi:hypothetical protein